MTNDRGFYSQVDDDTAAVELTSQVGCIIRTSVAAKAKIAAAKWIKKRPQYSKLVQSHGVGAASTVDTLSRDEEHPKKIKKTQAKSFGEKASLQSKEASAES